MAVFATHHDLCLNAECWEAEAGCLVDDAEAETGGDDGRGDPQQDGEGDVIRLLMKASMRLVISWLI